MEFVVVIFGCIFRLALMVLAVMGGLAYFKVRRLERALEQLEARIKPGQS